MVGTTSVSKKNRVFERMRITKEQKVTIKETLEVFPKIVRYFMVRKEMSTTNGPDFLRKILKYYSPQRSS